MPSVPLTFLLLSLTEVRPKILRKLVWRFAEELRKVKVYMAKVSLLNVAKTYIYDHTLMGFPPQNYLKPK